MNRSKNVHTFIGCDAEYDESKVVVFSAPFDGTTSYRPGTRFAGAYMRNESYGIETYSPYLDKDLLDVKVFDGGELPLSIGNTVRVLEQIKEYTASVLADGKISCMLGGEHLVTLGAVDAVFEKYPDLCIVHFDAHADLRDNYMGDKLSHSAVIRRCHELLGDGRIFQFGIRSGERDEFVYAKEHTHMSKFNFDGLDEAVKKLEGKPVYFTIDMDVLDPSIFPGTGTPEAGGVTFSQLLEAVYKVATLNIVACDINELSPLNDQSGVSTLVACKLLRELLLSIY